MKRKARRKKLLKKRISQNRSLRSKSYAKPLKSKKVKHLYWQRAKLLQKTFAQRMAIYKDYFNYSTSISAIEDKREELAIG